MTHMDGQTDSSFHALRVKNACVNVIMEGILVNKDVTFLFFINLYI
jgi:hypothetical protein